MKTALWIIAICEVIRAAQNMVQIITIKHNTKGRDNAYAEFVKNYVHHESITKTEYE